MKKSITIAESTARLFDCFSASVCISYRRNAPLFEEKYATEITKKYYIFFRIFF
jgi:hypothetical protein